MNFFQQEHRQYSFDAYCKKVLKNEAIDIQLRLKRERERFISFVELTKIELAKFSVVTDPF